MAKLSDISSDHFEKWQAEWDALSQKERDAQTEEHLAKLRKAIAGFSMDFSQLVNPVTARFEPPDIPEFESPFPKILDVLIAMQAELIRANKAARTAGRVAWGTLFVAALALLTNLPALRDWLVRLW